MPLDLEKTLIISIFAVSVLASQGAGIHDGLLNYWALDSDASDTAGYFAESTGVTTDNGVVNGGTTFSAGLFGNAANLPGGGGNHITVVDGGASTAGGVANDVALTMNPPSTTGSWTTV